MRKFLHIIFIGMFVLSPFSALALTATSQTSTAAPQFAPNGIYGCNQTSAAASSVAVFAGSGVYVPVNDAAVTLNTGYLVYLACTLNPLVSALSGSATAGIVKKIQVTISTGNNGNPYYSVNINKENWGPQGVANKTALAYFQGGALNNVNSALAPTVKTSLASGYAQAVQQPDAVLNCNISDLKDFENGVASAFNWTDFNTAIFNPACNAVGAAQLASDQLYGNIANAIANNMTELQWGQGFYPVVDQNGNVVTPASVVENQEQQALQAGLYKTENANSIGQLVGALFAGIGAQAVSGMQGLAGITQSIGNQPSYLDQVVSQASAAVQQDATNAAITTINGVSATLSAYINALNTSASTLIDTSDSLRNTESQCWDNIIEDVCTAGSFTYTNGSPTCTEVTSSSSTTGATLHIATSTAFSNAVIQSQLTPLGQSTSEKLQAAQTAQTQINQIIAGVTNSSSQDAQTLAIEQLDQLTSSNSFPSTVDMQNAQQDSTSLSTSMNTLVTQVVGNWQGFDSNGNQDLPWDGTVSANTVGWCNYNDKSTLLTWESLWSK